MAGFPLFSDEHIGKDLVKALRERGWDVVRAVDVFGQRTDDRMLFEYASAHGRVMVTTDEDFEPIATGWLREWRRFPGLVIWQQQPRQKRSTTGGFVRAFEALAAEQDPFAYPVRYLSPRD